ncbi:unnamed protein product [Arctia plantaginis]|uniref:Uncharacterized protein n=1 Tax=Arctia plantaginis TaxID=874455 RepID=A0A8S1AP50_ARCPL|nr:unnamed protein product [Arctia plantaginis]CAB3248061.1 unnamed protein product [Arctia plantaginis]
MNENIVEAEEAELDTGLCVCKDGPTLAILKDVQRMYEEKMNLIERIGGSKKLQLQLDVLRAWVNDLVGQNTLLVRAVEDLEAEATTKLVYERKRQSEVVSELRSELAAVRRRLARKDSDLRGLVEVLRRLREFDNCTLDGIHFFEITESDIFGSFEWRQKKLTGYPRYSKKGCGKLCELKLLNETLKKENVAKDREIRQLNKDAQQYEQTILNLRKEISLTKCTNTPDVSKRDAEVMAGMCCTGTECGDWEPVKDFSEMLQDETLQFQERIQQMESNLKSSSDSVRALRKVNVSLTEEMHAMRRLCAALVEENRAASVRAQFKDDIIREMRRQLKQAKAKLKETSEATELKPKDFVSGDGECPRGSSASYESVTIECVRAQPRRKRDVPLRESLLHRDATGNDSLIKTDIDHSNVLRGHTVSSNAISDAATCEEMRAYDCGHTQESDDDAFLNRE